MQLNHQLVPKLKNLRLSGILATLRPPLDFILDQALEEVHVGQLLRDRLLGADLSVVAQHEVHSAFTEYFERGVKLRP